MGIGILKRRSPPHTIHNLIPPKFHLEIIPAPLIPAPMTEISSPSNLHIDLEHVIRLTIGGFFAEGAFADLDVGVGGAEFGGGDSVIVAVVYYLGGGYVEGLIVF